MSAATDSNKTNCFDLSPPEITEFFVGQARLDWGRRAGSLLSTLSILFIKIEYYPKQKSIIPTNKMRRAATTSRHRPDYILLYCSSFTTILLQWGQYRCFDEYQKFGPIGDGVVIFELLFLKKMKVLAFCAR